MEDDPNIIDFTKESGAAKSQSAPPGARPGGPVTESAAPLPEEDLEEEKSEPAEFPIECLPPILANMAKAISGLGRWPLRLTAPLVLAAASASLGRGIRVRSYDGHETRPNIYLLIGKESGSGGTSAFRLAFGPIFGFQALKRREFANGLKPILEGECATLEAEIEYLKRQARGKKSADERREISKRITEVRKALRKLEEELCEPCFLTGDATPEGMTRLLAEHGESLLHADSDASDAISSIWGATRRARKVLLSRFGSRRMAESRAGRQKEGGLGASRGAVFDSGLSRHAIALERALRNPATLRSGLAAPVLRREPSLPPEQNPPGRRRGG